ncbi:MAG: ATP-dependent Clp protease ATP-binding subunit [Bacilli bacterium]|nr:ATP-dependent Clp protease ATP-binding subunit [Bacilli bacterium]
MFLKFTDNCQKLLYFSLKEKNKFNDDYIGTEYIFLGLLKMKSHYICKILNDNDISYENFSIFIKKREKKKDNYAFIFTPLMYDIFNNISKDKNSIVDICDIIVAILNTPSSKVNLILKNMSVNIKDILKSINVYSRKKNKNNKSVLNDIGVNLNSKCLNDGEVLLGREKELSEIIEVLCCRNKNNPLLIGDAGVGKTAIVEELSRMIESDNVPRRLQNKKIYSVAMSSLVAGTKYRGEFEEKINKLIMEVEEDDDIILFIDEIHTLVGAGGADGAIDASNILKPSLARGKIKIIGATTKEEYDKYILNDKALSRRFRIVKIEEPNIDKTRDILLGIKDIYERFHNVVISDKIIELVLEYSNRYINNRKFPDKAIDILDEVCVLTSFFVKDSYNSLDIIDKNIKIIIDKKNKSLLVGNYKEAIEYSLEEKKLLLKKGKIQEKILRDNKVIEVDEKSFFTIMERKTNIPFYTFKFNYNSINLLMNKYKKNSIFDKSIISKICEFTSNFYFNLINNINNNRLYIYSDKYNKSNFFIKEYLNSFFKDINKIYIDCNSIKNIDDLTINNKIISKVKDNCFSIIIFNNYDSKNILINEFLDDICNKGYYDSNNEKINFNNVLFIFNKVKCDNKLGFYKSEFIDEIVIDVSDISISKIKNKVRDYLYKNNIKLSNANIEKVSINICSNCDNFDNIDFYINNEIRTLRIIKENRPIKV